MRLPRTPFTCRYFPLLAPAFFQPLHNEKPKLLAIVAYIEGRKWEVKVSYISPHGAIHGLCSTGSPRSGRLDEPRRYTDRPSSTLMKPACSSSEVEASLSEVGTSSSEDSDDN